MKTKLMVLMLLASSSMFAAHVSVGVGIGGFGGGVYVAAPPPPPPVYYAPPAPGVGFTWVAG